MADTLLESNKIKRDYKYAKTLGEHHIRHITFTVKMYYKIRKSTQVKEQHKHNQHHTVSRRFVSV